MIISISIGTQNIFPKKYLLIIMEYVLKRLVKFDFKAVKKICLNKSEYSFLIDIANHEFSFWMSIIQDSSSESICFFIAGKVHQISLSNALIDIHCLRKIKYLRISTFVLLQKSFSRFMIEININSVYFIKIFEKNTRVIYILILQFLF